MDHFPRFIAKNNKKIVTILVVIFPIFCATQATFAQIISKDNAHQIISKLAAALIEKYPFPEISEQYKEGLLRNEAAGSYDNLGMDALAAKITADLQKIHKDVHLHVQKNEGIYKSLTTSQNADNNEAAKIISLRKKNYGFKGVELDAVTSTAYVNIPGPFYGTQESFEMAAAAMNMAAYSKYVILDVRFNPGGTGEMGRFLASYFYEAGDEKFYLNGFFKDKGKDVQEWTYSYVPGKRNSDAKVFILVGRGTGSASEGFAYAMQKLHRATIVGDTTAGAGIAGTYVALESNLIVFLPFKMVVAPNTVTGWEGTGVIPDSLTGKTDALAETRKMILADIIKNAGSLAEKDMAAWLMDNNSSSLQSGSVIKGNYPSFEGKYNNNISITYDKGGFTWNKAEPGKPVESYLMREVKPNVFAVINLNKNYGSLNSRVYIHRSPNGKIESLTRKILLDDGSIYIVPIEYKRL